MKGRTPSAGERENERERTWTVWLDPPGRVQEKDGRSGEGKRKVDRVRGEML